MESMPALTMKQACGVLGGRLETRHDPGRVSGVEALGVRMNE